MKSIIDLMKALIVFLSLICVLSCGSDDDDSGNASLQGRSEPKNYFVLMSSYTEDIMDHCDIRLVIKYGGDSVVTVCDKAKPYSHYSLTNQSAGSATNCYSFTCTAYTKARPVTLKAIVSLKPSVKEGMYRDSLYLASFSSYSNQASQPTPELYKQLANPTALQGNLVRPNEDAALKKFNSVQDYFSYCLTKVNYEKIIE